MGYYNKQNFKDALKNPADVTDLNIPAEDLSKCFIFNNLEILNISYGYNYVLPKEIANFKKLHTLNLGSLPNEFPAFLTEMTQLKHLHFPHYYRYNTQDNLNQKILFLDIFDKMESLESLNIYFTFCEIVSKEEENKSYNYPTIVLDVPESIFKMKKLKKLHLSINQVENLPKDAFLGLESLEELSLSYGGMTMQIQENIFSLKNLKKLDFNGNFVYLKAEMEQRTRFDAFSEKITNLKKLESLSITNSKITEIPTFFKKLTQLQELDFSTNDIKELTFLLSEMPNLQKLTLNGNKKLLIDKIFANKNNLRELELIACNLKNIPDSILNCGKLEKINFFANKLDFLSEKVLQLPNLLEINVDKNPFCKITELKTSTTVNNLLASFRKRNIPTNLQMLELALIQNHTEAFKNVQKEDFFACLYTPNTPIRRNALSALENHIKNPFSLKLEKEKTVISVLGDVSGVKITELTNFFKEKEYKIISKITDKTTHICLGEQPKISLETILKAVSEQKIELALPKHLKDFQQLLEKPYLLDVSEDMTNNILDLLKSGNIDNQQLAIQMMDTGGVPDEALYVLVLMMMGNFHANFEGKSKKIRQLLAKYAPSGLLGAVERHYRKGTDNGIKLFFQEDIIDKKAFLCAGLCYFPKKEVVKYNYENHYNNLFVEWGLKAGGEYAKIIFKTSIKDDILDFGDNYIDAKYVFIKELAEMAEITEMKFFSIRGSLGSLNQNIPTIKKIEVNYITDTLQKKLQKLFPQVKIIIKNNS